MKKQLKVTLAVLATLAFIFVLTLPITASAQPENFNISQGIVGNLKAECRDFGNCTWCDFIDLIVILQKVILSLFGGLALIMFIWGGQGIIMAAGNQEKVTASRKLLTSTLFGVLIVLAGYFLINIIVGILITPAGSPMKTQIWNADWWRAYCIKDVTDPTYCQGKPTGTACEAPNKGLVCDENGKCDLPTCPQLAKENPGYNIACQNTDCNLTTQREYGGYCSGTQKCCGNQ